MGVCGRGLTELLVLLAVQSYQSFIMMFKLIISSLLLGGCLAQPFNNTRPAGSWLSPEAWQNYWDYLPKSLQTYLDNTYTKGKDLAYDIYDDLKEEVGERALGHFKEFEELLGDVSEKAERIMYSAWEKVEGLHKPVTEEEKQATELEIESLTKELDDLAEKVQQEQEAEAALPDVFENQIQKFITAGRQMLTVVGEGQEIFLEKMKQMQVELYKLNLLVAEASGEVKTKLNSIVESIEKIDLQKIGEGDQPRDFD